MRVTILGSGTSQGVPVIGCACAVCASTNPHDKRLRASILLQHEDGTHVVIDSGPDFRQQMLREGIARLDAVVFTHPHKDHTGGLDDVRAFNHRQGRPMQVYANALTQHSLRLEYHYVFDPNLPKHPGIPKLDFHDIDSDPFAIGGLRFQPIPVMHGTMPVLAFRLGNFAYVTDTNFISEASYAALTGVEVLVLDALEQSAHVSHFTLRQAIEAAQRIGARQTWLTHVSHRMGLADEVGATLPQGINFASDGLVLDI